MIYKYSKLSFKNSKGLSLIEVIVVLAVMGITMFPMSLFLLNSSKLMSDLMTKGEILEFQAELGYLVANENSCENAMQGSSGPATFSGGTSTIHSIKKPTSDFITLGNEPKNYTGFKVQSISLTDSGLSPTVGTYTDSASTTHTGSSHVVDLILNVELQNGTQKGSVRQIKKSLKIFVDGTTNQVVSCYTEPKTVLKVAVARRHMIAIHHTNCVDTPDPIHYQANPVGAGCVDDDDNKLCDGTGNSVAVKAHPMSLPSHRIHALWLEMFPTRQTGVNPLLQDEGRCGVRIVKNDSSDPVHDIFILKNKTTPWHAGGNEGIGCNSANGWFLMNCNNTGWGMGDSDTIINTIDGNDYCLTNDHAQPHGSGGAEKEDWLNSKTTLALTCGKLYSQ